MFGCWSVEWTLDGGWTLFAASSPTFAWTRITIREIRRRRLHKKFPAPSATQHSPQWEAPLRGGIGQQKLRKTHPLPTGLVHHRSSFHNNKLHVSCVHEMMIMHNRRTSRNVIQIKCCMLRNHNSPNPTGNLHSGNL
ncbi:hypothetical protein DdX_05502 [Ditylenchus destructor]|uniref:Uncharacterized protein n=1 Tax=Ditylenchus destructor TaxID=166010 RepID=A0AAD4N929_9BILA|nr:hypothetical protein DdX_05502 [Ditylenchus destructor]